MKLLLTIIMSLLLAKALEASSFRAQHADTINLIINAADTAHIPRELLLAVCWVESSYRKDLPARLDGDTPSYGLCQVKLETAQHMDKVYKHRLKVNAERLENPRINAFYAAKYIKFQLKRYNGNWKKAIDAYNKGSYSSTNSQYVRKVLLAIQLHK